MERTSDEAAAFYREMAGQYDRMTRFVQRLPGERAMLEAWRTRHGFRRVLDAACGTGLHAIALAQLGAEVTGADLSPEMLARALYHAEEAGVKVKWIPAAMQTLAQAVEGPFDALLCLGNSLPHLIDREELTATLTGFHRLLAPGGLLLLQWINYDAVLARKRRIVAIHRDGETEFIRFYDFGDPLLRFNILEIDWSLQPPIHRLQSVMLYPWRRVEVEAAVIAAGFGGMEIYGDMERGKYAQARSQNLVLAARR